jgi:hypothetical protein
MNITKGKVYVVEFAGSHFILDADNVEGRSIDDDESVGRITAQANAECMAESINVANECGLSPRQLLEQRGELLRALKPFERLADEVISNGNMREGQTVYEYNKVQITLSDLNDVKSAIQKATGK